MGVSFEVNGFCPFVCYFMRKLKNGKNRIFFKKKVVFMNMPSLMIIIIGISLLLLGTIVMFGIDKVINYITIVLGIANIVLVCITAASLYYAREANKRSKDLFVGENLPLLDVAPIGIVRNSKSNQIQTLFSITNYSGFCAYNIGIDLKYGGSWILEWKKAEIDRIAKGDVKGVENNKIYETIPRVRIGKLESGETYPKANTERIYGIIGSLDIDQVCESGNEGIEVQVRVVWKNEKNRIFDSVHQYRLVCTKVREGRSFTYVPKGIISNK